MLIYYVTPINKLMPPAESNFLNMGEYQGIYDLVQVVGFQGPSQYNAVGEQAILWQFNGFPFNAVTSPTQEDIPLGSAGATSQALGVNSVFPSDVVGWQTKADGLRAPVRWRKSGTTVLGSLGGNDGEARAVNNTGTIAGVSFTATGVQRAFRFNDNAGDRTLHDLGTFGGQAGEAFGINNSGMIVGYATDANQLERAFIWTPGGTDGVPGNPQMKWLIPDYANIYDSRAYDINDKGHVVGRYYEKTAGGIIEHGFFWSPSTGYKKLSSLGYSSSALSINEQDVISGSSVAVAGGESRAVTWNNMVITDLNTAMANPSGLILTKATGINSRGDLVCLGYLPGNANVYYGILLTPILTYSVVHPPYPFIKWPFYNIYDPLWFLHLWDSMIGDLEKNPGKVKDVSILANLATSVGVMKNERVREKVQKFLLQTIGQEVNEKGE